MKKGLFYVFLWLAVFATVGLLCLYDAPIWGILLAVGITVALWVIVKFGFRKEFSEWYNGGKYENDFNTDDNIGLSGEGFRFESQYSQDFDECYSIAVTAEFERDNAEANAKADRIIEVLNSPKQLKLDI